MKNPRIIIQNGSFEKIPHLVRGLGERFAILTDSHLKKLGEELCGKMRKAGLRTHLLVIPPGEQAKTLGLIEKVCRSLVNAGLKRDSVLLGLGGGVIGDLGGFAASIFMRGIPFVSIPTTTLAMADASIGGKTGVDLPEGKNLVGTFSQPRLVIMDPLLLKTLSEREFRNGLAEIIKHSIIADAIFFRFLRKYMIAILARKPEILKKMILWSVRIKQQIVEKDVREKVAPFGRINKVASLRLGLSRMLLNYGHTVGHALEVLSDFKLSHGEAVSIGMIAENRVAVGKNLLHEEDAKRILEVLKNCGLPTKIPAEYSPSEIHRALSLDKKNIGGKLYFALPVKIGKAKVIPL